VAWKINPCCVRFLWATRTIEKEEEFGEEEKEDTKEERIRKKKKKVGW
jgi:hypothetical protein